MDKVMLNGKEFPIVTYANAVATECNLKNRSAFSDSLLFNLRYNLSGVDTNKDWSELTPEEQSRVMSLRGKTPVITAKDSGLRIFVLNELNKGKETSERITLDALNKALFAPENFGEDGKILETANDTLKRYCDKVAQMLLAGTRNVYYVSMPVSELTNGTFTTWKPEYSENPLVDVVAYEIDMNNMQAAAMAAAARMFVTLENEETPTETGEN